MKKELKFEVGEMHQTGGTTTQYVSVNGHAQKIGINFWSGDIKAMYESKELAECIASIPNMVDALEWAYNEIKILQKQIPLKNSYNVATEEGKTAWEKHIAGMIKIERALSIFKKANQ